MLQCAHQSSIGTACNGQVRLDTLIVRTFGDQWKNMLFFFQHPHVAVCDGDLHCSHIFSLMNNHTGFRYSHFAFRFLPSVMLLFLWVVSRVCLRVQCLLPHLLFLIPARILVPRFALGYFSPFLFSFLCAKLACFCICSVFNIQHTPKRSSKLTIGHTKGRGYFCPKMSVATDDAKMRPNMHA